MPTVERLKPNIFWICPYCGEKVGDWPIGPQGHLIGQHSPSDTSAQTVIVSLALPDFGDEEDIRGKRYRLHCPFCEVSSTYQASFKNKADLKAHLTSVHGCS